MRPMPQPISSTSASGPTSRHSSQPADDLGGRAVEDLGRAERIERHRGLGRERDGLVELRPDRRRCRRCARRSARRGRGRQRRRARSRRACAMRSNSASPAASSQLVDRAIVCRAPAAIRISAISAEISPCAICGQSVSRLASLAWLIGAAMSAPRSSDRPRPRRIYSSRRRAGNRTRAHPSAIASPIACRMIRAPGLSRGISGSNPPI